MLSKCFGILLLLGILLLGNTSITKTQKHNFFSSQPELTKNVKSEAKFKGDWEKYVEDNLRYPKKAKKTPQRSQGPG